MFATIGIIGGLVVFCVVIIWYLIKQNFEFDEKEEYLEEKRQETYNDETNENIILLKSKIENLEKILYKIPEKVLQSISGSVNFNKGKIGELISYLNLRQEYDRIIPLGDDIVDFLCVRFPTEKDPGVVAFIDIKTGPASKLSKHQRFVKGLITNKKVVFITYRVNQELASNDNKTEV